MRFNELPIGARFEFEGRSYTKTNALTAHDDNGKPRLIPRSANVSAMEGTVAAATLDVEGNLSAVQIRSALDRYHTRCIALLDELPEDKREGLEAQLERIRSDVERDLFGKS